jgi:sugar lactone lactonase YvrE
MKKNYVFLFCLFVGQYFLNAQTIVTTIVGTATAGATGDGSAATLAELYNPTHVVFDKWGNLYIADYDNHKIRKVNTAGIISTVAGTGTAGYSGNGGQATAAKLNSPSGVAVDTLGNFFIADASNNRVRKVNTAGIITSIAGTGTGNYSGDGGAATAAELYEPFDLEFDAVGNLYIVENINNVIRKINTAGIISTVAGNILIADRYSHVVRKVNTSGIITTIAGTGNNGFSGDGGQATDAEFHYTSDVAVDNSGNVYVVDEHNNCIRMIDPTGVINTIAGCGCNTMAFGGDGGAPLAAKFFWPGGVMLDAAGVLYITDTGNNRVRKIDVASTTGIKSVIEKSKLSIYPNPALNSITVNGSEYLTQMKVIDVLGNELIQVKLHQGKATVDINALPAGIYFIKTNEGIQKFIKQ